MSSFFSAIASRPTVAQPLKEGQFWTPLGTAADLPWVSPQPDAPVSAPQGVTPKAVSSSPPPSSEASPTAPTTRQPLASRAPGAPVAPPTLGGSRLPDMAGDWRDVIRQSSGADVLSGLPEVGGASAFDYEPISDAALDYERGRHESYSRWYDDKIAGLPDPPAFDRSGGEPWYKDVRVDEMPRHWSALQKEKAIYWIRRASNGGRR